MVNFTYLKYSFFKIFPDIEERLLQGKNFEALQ